MLRPPALALGLGIGLGVSSVSCASTPTTTAPEGTSTTTAPTSRPKTGASYEVHEWGLIRAQLGNRTEANADAVSVGAIPPPARHRYAPMEKPVLYFHTDAPLELARVTVTTPESEIIEAWPVPRTRGANSITWSSVRLDPGSACDPSALPASTDAPCGDLPAWLACESERLDVVRAPSAACVGAGTFRDRFLFYRALSTKFIPPLRFDPIPQSDDVKVTNIGSTPVPGLLVRIVPRDARADSVVAVPPAPGASITVGLKGVEGQAGERIEAESLGRDGPGPSALRIGLRDLGLDADEADAFLRAWSTPLFATAPPAEEKVMEEGAKPSFVYFLPPATIDAISKLDLDPPPRAVKRAFAVWATL
ncbi:MAG: hypothetical protein U0414_01655 [Polyangiaceae bacterium]